MRYALIVCRVCGHQEKVEVLTDEDIRRDPQRPRSLVRCPHCGTTNVEVH